MVSLHTSVMDLRRKRSSDVSATLAEPQVVDFELLYRAARDDIYGYIATLLRDRSAAEDVTAITFERAYKRRRGYDARRGSPRAWLFGIARNAALDELRRRKRQLPLDAEPADPDTPAPEDEAEAAVRRAAVRAALTQLEPRDRELIALKFHAGLDNAEVAAVLGVNESNAGTRLHRAMQKLRKALDDA